MASALPLNIILSLDEGWHSWPCINGFPKKFKSFRLAPTTSGYGTTSRPPWIIVLVLYGFVCRPVGSLWIWLTVLLAVRGEKFRSCLQVSNTAVMYRNTAALAVK